VSDDQLTHTDSQPVHKQGSKFTPPQEPEGDPLFAAAMRKVTEASAKEHATRATRKKEGSGLSCCGNRPAASNWRELLAAKKRQEERKAFHKNDKQLELTMQKKEDTYDVTANETPAP